eukprot:CFRG8093T1
MAEAVFTSMVANRGISHKWTIDSAGTADYHVGKIPDRRTISCCLLHGVPVNSRARQVTAEDFYIFDYILCMDQSNLENLVALQKQTKSSTAVLKRFGDYDPEGASIIEDPYYGGDDGFEVNFQQAMRCSAAFLDQAM